MSDKLFIGIGHKCRQGKDTFASAIHHMNPRSTRIIGFADALKAVCRVDFGMTVKDPAMLQSVGVLRRAENPTVWIDAVYAAAVDALEPVIVVPDVRFPNEAEFIKDHGGVLVKIERTTFDGPYVSPDRDPTHQSETALDDWLEWDYVVTNPEGRQQALRQSALTIFTEVMMRRARTRFMTDQLREVE